MRGIQVTTGANIQYANDNDYTLNTKFIGGMKIGEKKIFIPSRDATTTSGTDYRQIVYSHNLGYIPAVMCFQSGVQGNGWQNEAVIFSPSASADKSNVYIMTDYFNDDPVYVLIFYEKVSDS